MASPNKSEDVIQAENASSVALDDSTTPSKLEGAHAGFNDDDDALHGFTANLDTLPKGYYTSSYFLGTMCATGFGLMAGVGGFALAAPNLTLINAEIGPDDNYVWISLIYTLALAVGLMLVGRLSDLFGRRWFFISGEILALIGCIVAATAQSIPVLIGAMLLISLAASTQLSFPAVSNELVPMKYRFLVNSWLYIWTLPISGFGPAVSKAFILYTSVGWRGGFYLMIGVNAVSGILYFFFYHPPTFHEKFLRRSRTQQLKEFDYVGTFLFMAGLVLFLMGLSWGGSVYPWNSAATISTLVIGFVSLVIFALWEAYAPLKEPLVPTEIFRNFSWVAASANLGLGASVYYGMAIVWPQMVAVLYTDDGGASIKAGFVSSLIGVMIVAGQLFAGVLAVPIGKTKIQIVVVMSTGAALLAAVASCGPDDFIRATVLISLGCFFIGWNEAICLANVGIDIDDQQKLGAAIGAGGSMRSAISTLASTVYVVTLTNRLGKTIPEMVPTAVVAAGLPVDSVVAYLGGFATGDFSGVVGLTAEIAAAGGRAYKEASAKAYSTVFLVTLVFSGMGIVLSFYTPNVDEKMTNQVAVTLSDGKQNLEKSEVV